MCFLYLLCGFWYVWLCVLESIDLRNYFIVLLLFFLLLLLSMWLLLLLSFLNMKLHIEYCFWLQLNFGYFYWLSEFFLHLLIHFSLNFSISISKTTEMRERRVMSLGSIPRYLSFDSFHSLSLPLSLTHSHTSHFSALFPLYSLSSSSGCVCVFEFFPLPNSIHSFEKIVCLIVIIFSIYLVSYSGRMSINGYYCKLFEQHVTL